MMPDLPTIWAALICIALLAYVVLDGFDLGVGILFPLGRNREERDTMMNTVAPVWDGNETWLVLGGGGLFAAFPLAYSVLLTAFYAPVIAMLLALVLRGVAFEFRFRTERWRPFWDLAFIGGSSLAAFFQGVMVGAFVQGVQVENGAYAGGWFDWLTPFTLLTGVSLVAGYALLGACWLVIKTEGVAAGAHAPLADSARCGGRGADRAGQFRHGARKRHGAGTLVRDGLVSVPLGHSGGDRCQSPSHSSPRCGHAKKFLPFLLVLCLFVASFVGLTSSLYPYLIPPGISYTAAANADVSLAFMLVGAVVLLPVILGYTAYVYWLFRGKVRAGEGYH